ncbi:MAG: hypothetical protein D6743_08725 [Calditrichaeota bacterium]|nr:MAG: hypothetical protein D6743_08725 [Calditrichota bacterium]
MTVKPNSTEKGKYTSLDEKLYELQALFDLSKALNSSLNLRTILDTILLTPMGKMLIGKGLVLLAKKDKKFVIETLKGLPKSLLNFAIQVDDYPHASDPTYVRDLPPSPWQAFLQKNGIEVVVPILHDEKTLGLAGYGKKILGGDFEDSDLEYLHSLSNIAATAIQNGLIVQELQDVNRELDKRVQELNTLFEIGNELNSTLDVKKVQNLLAYSVMGEMMVNRCAIYLAEKEKMALSLNKGFQEAGDMERLTDESLLQALCDLTRPVLVGEGSSEPFCGSLAHLPIRAIVPMRIQNQTKGAIALGEKITKGDFTKEELEFLSTLASMSMTSIENARLFEETLEKQRLEEELLIAREIQKQLLPKSCPQIENFEVAAVNISSREVGGDYFDCVELSKNRYAFCIGDVSGKGAPAALLMANLQASFHALVDTGLSIEEVTARINNLIHRNTGFDKFITFFFGILDLAEKSFVSVNAGHNPPYLFHADGTFQTLQEGGLILGMMPNVSYVSESVTLVPGDCLVMFTDGVSEAMNAEEEEFEEKRIEACVRATLERSAEEILNHLIESVKAFSAGLPQMDDITSLIIKVY